MIESLEFLALILTILGGHFVSFGQFSALRKEIEENKIQILKDRDEMKIELTRCRLHPCMKEEGRESEG